MTNHMTAELTAEQLEAEADRIGTIKMKLLLYVPFWASILIQTRLVADQSLPFYGATDCVDVICYNPRLTTRLSTKQLAFLLLHECAHIVFEHGTRKGGRSHDKWNRAADYVVNLITSDIKKDHAAVAEFIPGGLLDQSFRGLSTEDVYDKLPTHSKGSSTCHQPGSPTNGSDFGGGIDIHLPSPTGQDAKDRVLEKILKAHAQWEASNQRGDIPAGVLLRINDLRNSAVPWQRVLREQASQCLGHDELTYAPPHRRRLLRDNICAPTLRGERLGSVVVVIDTSGSIDHAALAQALSELVALSDLTDDLCMISHDAAVQDVIPTHRIAFYVADLKVGKAKLNGGGGTNHKPAFEWVAKNHPGPDLLIAFTDMDSLFPDKAPSYPVLWCVWPKDNKKPFPFGRVVTIRDSDV